MPAHAPAVTTKADTATVTVGYSDHETPTDTGPHEIVMTTEASKVIHSEVSVPAFGQSHTRTIIVNGNPFIRYHKCY